MGLYGEEHKKFVSKRKNCQQEKAKHQKSSCLLQEIHVLTWKCEDINMDFLLCVPWTQKQYDSILDIAQNPCLLIRRRIMQGPSYMRLSIAMVFRYPSYQIGVHNSHICKGWELQ